MDYPTITPTPPRHLREMTARYSDDPALRVSEAGAGSVSNAELLVALIGVPHERAVTILRDGWNALAGMRVPELRQQHGLTERQARVLAAAMEVGARKRAEGFAERYQIKSPGAVAELLMEEMSHLDQEHLRVVLLDTKNRVMEVATVYIGSVNTAVIRIGEVFKPAIRRNAAAIILCHNHPSGDPTPSPEDVLVTRNVVAMGKGLDCECMDHIVVGKSRFVSMRERGLGFSA